MPRYAPNQSIEPPALRIPLSEGTTIALILKTTAPNIALNSLLLGKHGEVNYRLTHKKKKSHFQCVSWAKRPPKTLPPAAPIGAMAPKSPIAILRSFPGGRLMFIKATALGTKKAPPAPVSPLVKDNPMILRINPLIRDHSTHHAAAQTRVRL